MIALATLRDLPLIGILRGFTCDQLPEILSAAADGGLRNLEITMNSPEAAAQIRLARQLAGGRLSVGAGTVTSMQLLRTALDAGAMFIVTPALNREVVAECVRQKIPVCPGAASRRHAER